MSSAATKKTRREDNKLHADTEGEVTDFLTHRELGRVRTTERGAQSRRYSAAITKITVPRNSDIPLNFWQRYNLETVTEIDGKWSNMTDADLEYIVAQECPNLTSLDLTKDASAWPANSNITNAGLIALARGCPKLVSLNLRGCHHITRRGMIALAQGCPQLSSLNLQNCRGITDAAVIALSQECPELSSLNFTWCKQITDAAVIALSKGCPRLSFLDLTFCEELTDESVIALAQGCPELATLNLYGCHHVTYAAVTALAGCRKLKKLDLQYTGFGDYDDWKLLMHNAQSFFETRVRRRGGWSSASGAARQLASQLVSAFGPLRF